MEKQVKRKNIYQGKIIDVDVDEVVIEDGSQSIREVVTHPGGVCIALKNEKNEYAMVNQYRYAQNKDMWEFPAGKLEKNEDPTSAILREAQEETGYDVKDLKALGKSIPSPGFLTEVVYLYSGNTNQFVGQHLDEDEFLQLQWFTFDHIKEMILKGEIEDAKTIALAFKIMF
ncbi:MAG: NUDIX hydrolase [Erysipelotrichaceae bacterium]